MIIYTPNIKGGGLGWREGEFENLLKCYKKLRKRLWIESFALNYGDDMGLIRGLFWWWGEIRVSYMFGRVLKGSL